MAMWKAITKDGNEINELTHNWESIKNNIKELSLVTNDSRIIKLPPNREKYVQAKTASADLSGGKNVQIESRYIGFSLGNTIVKIRINESDNNISIEV